MPYKVKEVAELAGVSVRTLHHYDQIGLLKPAAVTAANYRLYDESHLERLQQILFFKELGFELQEIKQILDQPDFDRRRALKSHKQLLLEKKKRLEDIIRTVDKTIKAIEGGKSMSTNEMFEGFDMKSIEEHKAKYSDEAKRLWGKDRVEASERKTSRYSKEKWAAITANAERIYATIVAHMDNGPEDPQVQQAVGEFRQHITDNFYDCTLEIFRGLGELYVADERFTVNIDKYRPGLSEFLRQAFHVYCDRMEQLQR